MWNIIIRFNWWNSHLWNLKNTEVDFCTEYVTYDLDNGCIYRWSHHSDDRHRIAGVRGTTPWEGTSRVLRVVVPTTSVYSNVDLSLDTSQTKYENFGDQMFHNFVYKCTGPLEHKRHSSFFSGGQCTHPHCPPSLCAPWWHVGVYDIQSPTASTYVPIFHICAFLRAALNELPLTSSPSQMVLAGLCLQSFTCYIRAATDNGDDGKSGSQQDSRKTQFTIC